MAGETETTETTTDVVETTETAPPAETQTAEAVERHPLEPGGVRFNEVYARMKESERRETELRERLARLEGQVQTQPPAHTTQQPQFYTADQLQALVDQGRISPAKMAEQLAWQAKELAKRELRTEWVSDQRKTTALQEVNQYLDKIPALANQSSAEFAKVRRAAFEIADETGMDVGDPRVQKRALRETFGTLDRIAQTAKLQDYSRQHADTHVETAGGGGANRTQQTDPLKNVPPELLAHWKRLNYTPERMKAELPYVNLDKWKRR